MTKPIKDFITKIWSIRITSAIIFQSSFYFLLAGYLTLVFCYIFNVDPIPAYFVSLPLIIIFAVIFLKYLLQIDHTSIITHPWWFFMVLILIVLLFLNTFTSPYPPIFNIHAFNIIDLGIYYISNITFPFHFSESWLIPTSVYTSWHPQQNLLGFFLSSFSNFSDSVAYQVLIADISSIIVFLISAFAVLSLTKRNQILFLFTFIVTILSIPHIYEVFIKYPSSDSFTTLCTVGILVSAINSINRQKYLFLIFVLAFSNILRTYFIFTSLIFIIILIIYESFYKDIEPFNTIKSIIKSKSSYILFLLLLVLSVSFFIIIEREFSGVSYMLGLQSSNISEEKVKSEFIEALGIPNRVELNNKDELMNSLTTNSIYYKTFDVHAPKTSTPIKNALNTLFSTSSVLFFFFFLALICIYYRFKFKHIRDYRLFFDIPVIWCVAVLLTWLIVGKISPNATIMKIFFMAIPAVAMIIGATFSYQFKPDHLKKSILSKIVLSTLFTIFVFNHFIKPIQERENITKQFNNIGNIAFFEKYGYKKDIVTYIQKNEILKENILWIVRGEHGGFLPYFLNDGLLWEYSWYEDKKYVEIHKSANIEDVLYQLKKEKFTHIISMKNQELQKFILAGFHDVLGYPEQLIKMIMSDSPKLELVFEEKKFRGLELRIFKIL